MVFFMKKSNNRTPYVFYTAMVLLCLVLVSAYMTGGMFARYTTSVTGGDSARVAKYDVSISALSKTDFSLNSFDQGALSSSCTFTVTSNSEVAVKYSLIITFPEALPTWLTVTVDDDKVTTVNGNVCTFSDVGSFDPGSHTATHTFKLAAAPGWHNNDIAWNNVSVSIVAEQID